MSNNEFNDFVIDVKQDLANNFDSLFQYYGFLDHHNIRKIVFKPDNELNFFEGEVVSVLDQRYQEFFKSKFNREMNELERLDILELIKVQLPAIHSQFNT